jgi:hypothetical protein
MLSSYENFELSILGGESLWPWRSRTSGNQDYKEQKTLS